MLKVEMRELTIIICDLCGDEITKGHISVEKNKKKLHFHYLGKKKCINKYNSEELKKHKFKHKHNEKTKKRSNRKLLQSTECNSKGI